MIKSKMKKWTKRAIVKKSIFTILIFLTCQNIFSQAISDCSICSRAVLNESQLSGKSLEELALLRNEIFARKGYVFSTQEYSQHFESQDWYTPIQSNAEIILSEIESKNVEFIKKLESKEKTKRDKALNSLVAQDTIRFTWKAEGKKSASVQATKGKTLTVNWGDGTVETKIDTPLFYKTVTKARIAGRWLNTVNISKVYIENFKIFKGSVKCFAQKQRR